MKSIGPGNMDKYLGTCVEVSLKKSCEWGAMEQDFAIKCICLPNDILKGRKWKIWSSWMTPVGNEVKYLKP
jgi:hypothetical protein